MIPKISSGNNYFGLLNYLEDKEKKLSQSETGMELVEGTQRMCVEGFPFSHNIQIDSDKKLLDNAFGEWDSKCKSKRFEKKVAHFSLSFAPHDTVDKEKVVVIAREFLERMGYKNIPMAIYQHNDKHHNHIHIVTSRVGTDGKKINHDNEAKRAIVICRELETKYNLFQVVKGESKQTNLEQVSSKTVNASADIPFKNAIVQNLQYYINTEKVKDIPTLQKMLLLHKIEMVLHDKDGNRLPRNGVRFYFKEGNKIVSYLSGSNIEKNFIANLEKKLLQNEKGIQHTEQIPVKKEEAKEFIPTYKPNFAVQKEIGVILYDAIQDCSSSVLVTPADLIKLLEVHKIVPEFKTDNKGNLTGLSFIYNKVRYKGSDFTVKGVKLSAALLAPHFITELNETRAVRIAIDSAQLYIKATGDILLSKKELIEILNRQNIRLVENAEGKPFLVINQLGKKWSINLEKYPGGYAAFLKAVGYDGITDLPKDLKDKIQKPHILAKPLSLQERFVYNSLLKGNVKDIQEAAKIQVQIALTPTETKKLAKSVVLLNYYNSIHNRMSRAAAYLSYQSKKTTQKPSLYETIKSLNLRGISVTPIFKDSEGEPGTKQLKNIEFNLKGETVNAPLNFFQTVPAFNAETLMEMFDNLSPKDEKLLADNPKESGIYFEFSDEITNMFLAAESDPSLINEFQEEILENHPELNDEVAYIESLEDTGGLYVYPDAPETHYLSTLFKDFGTMVNRGGDISDFKALKRKKAKRI